MDRDRRAAFLILKDIEEEQSWSNLAVGRQFSKENPNSPAFVREIVYGVLRNQNLLDFNINRYLAKPKLKNNEKILLRMGFYQLAFMDVKPYAAISETVNLAKSIMKGREGFINAVLRSFEAENCPIKYSKSKDIVKQYSVNYSASQSIVKLIVDAYGEEQTEAILKVLCTLAPLSIRVNTLKTSKEELAAQLSALGFELTDGKYANNLLYVKGSGLLDTKLYKDGLFAVQGEASLLSIQTLAPATGSTLADLCAAPGGKSCAAAELMQNSGKILAYDLHPHRVELINKEAERLGIEIIDAKAADSTINQGIKADYVLCDVPCSGLGTLRRNPELKLKEIDPSGLIPIQAQILKNAADYSTGRIVYSTCTINPAENEEQVRNFLAENPSWILAEEKKILPEENGPDGFYIALLKKND